MKKIRIRKLARAIRKNTGIGFIDSIRIAKTITNKTISALFWLRLDNAKIISTPTPLDNDQTYSTPSVLGPKGTYHTW
jgi:hypothetical protein